MQKVTEQPTQSKKLLYRVSDALQNGYDTPHLWFGAGVRMVQELLGHKDVKTTMIYTHVLQRGGLAVRSPLDD